MRTGRRRVTALVVGACLSVLVSGCSTPGNTPTSGRASWAFAYESLDSALASTQQIVKGTVTDAVAVSDANGIPYVTATLDVEEVLAGEVGNGAIPVQQYGAESQDPGIPHLSVGSTYLLFLERFSFEGHYEPCGEATGMYAIAAWAAWQQQDDGSYLWQAATPAELPVSGYPGSLAEADLAALPVRWATARQNAEPADICGA